MNIVKENKSYTYVLEPGDATRYRFSLQLLGPADAIVHSGIAGHDYALVTVLMGSYKRGAAVGSRESFRKPINPFLGYLRSHGMGGVDEFTLAAITLACSHLVDFPEEAGTAAMRMLLAPMFLADDGINFDLEAELNKENE